MSAIIQAIEKLLGRVRIWVWFGGILLLLVSGVSAAVLGAWTWFMHVRPVVASLIVFVLAFGAVFFALTQIRRFQPEWFKTRLDRAGDVASVGVTSFLYAACPHIDVQHLREGLYLNFEIVFFKAPSVTLILDEIAENMVFTGVVNAPEQMHLDLPTPSFRNVYGNTKFTEGEFVLVLEQRVTRELANVMMDALEAGNSLEFKLTKLAVYMRSEPAFGSRVMLPLPEGIHCTLCGNRTFTRKVTFARIHFSTRLPATSPI